MDTFTEVLHVFKVLHPESVENLEINFAFNLTHDIGAKFKFLGGVSFFNGKSGKLGALFFFTLETDFDNKVTIKIENRLEFFDEVTIYADAFGGQISHSFLDEAINLVRDICPFENSAAHEIDDTTMTVDDVIVLNHVFTGIEIETFDTLLGGFEHLGDTAILNWSVFINADTV